MKFQYCLAAALSMLLAFLGQSIALYIPASRVNTTSTDVVGLGPSVKRSLDRICLSSDADAAFFEPTRANWEASRAGERYLTFARDMVQSSKWSSKETEPSLFALRTISWSGFACGVDNNGCEHRPTCDDVLTKLGDKDEARWVWFVLESMHHVTKVGAVVEKETVRSQISIAPLAESAAHNFLWKYDESVENKCKLLSGLVKAGIMAAFALLGAVLPAAAPAVAGALPAALGVSASSSAFLAANGGKFIQFGLAFGSAFPTNVGGDAIDRSVDCPYANAPKELEEKTRRQIKEDVIRFYGDYRKLIMDTNNDLVVGTVVADNPLLGPGTLLAHVIKSGDYLHFTLEQAARFERKGYLVADDMTQYYKNSLVSTLLKAQMCYIECAQEPFLHPDHTNFEPEQGKFCKATCWQNWAGEKHLELFGLKKMEEDENEWGLELQAFLKASYDHYKEHRFQPDPMLPSQEDLFDNTVKPTSGSYLPVCDSYLTPPKHKKHHSGIPCMCGDKYGSETAQFLEAANFQSWHAVEVTGDFYKKLGPVYLCQNDMAKSETPPVDYFLNMCNSGWRWPTKVDKYPDRVYDAVRHLTRGPDPICDNLKTEAEAYSSQGVDVNCFMCKVSSQGKSVRSGKTSQLPWIRNVFHDVNNDQNKDTQDYNFQRACDIWEDNNGKCFE
ncbi:MAG: hypothetical protein Q9180_004264 [Flavoplaca navasiana]